MTTFIFGAGYSCRAFAAANPATTPIFGTTRSPENFGRLEAAGIRPLAFAGDATDEVFARLRDMTHLILSIAPDERGDPALPVVREADMPYLQWIGYLSTVGVYGDHAGAWIDESSACRPVSRRSVQRLRAEEDWKEFAGTRGVPLSILRLSGIYGPGRNAFVNLENGTAKRLVKPGQVFNRIHVDDIAGSLRYLATERKNGAFNVTDDEPAPPQDVVTYAAALMDIPPPQEVPFETAELTPMARSFYGENKRVSNKRLRGTGYDFRYPNYRMALDSMWMNDTWRGVGNADARSPMRK